MKTYTPLKALLAALAVIAISTSLSAQTPKKILIGTSGTYKQVTFFDENNVLTGFEIEALKEVNKLLPQYAFEFKTQDFATILVSLETGKIDIAANQFESNPDRRAKFLYATEGVTRYDQRIAIKADRADVNSLDDLAKIGATVQAGSASSNNTYVINKWNDEHGKKLKVVLAPSDPLVTVQNISNGKIDAFVTIERTVDDYIKTYNAKVKVVGDPIWLSNAYYLYRKNDPAATQLQKDIDGALAKLKDNGTLKQLSNKWLGGDYIPVKGK